GPAPSRLVHAGRRPAPRQSPVARRHRSGHQESDRAPEEHGTTMTTPSRLTGWRKSSYSNHGGASCVEVMFAGTQVRVRDSKYLRDPANDPARQPVIAIPAHLWHAFLDLATGYREASDPALPTVTARLDGSVSIQAA